MKKYDVNVCKLIYKEEIASRIFDFVIKAQHLSKISKAGQFVHILVPGKTLRRPISICQIDADAGTLRLVFQVKGEGTEILSKTEVGADLDLLAPLGNGFPPVQKDKKVLLVGGGIGVPPLLEVASVLKERAVSALGFQNKGAVILDADFRKTGSSVFIATDDGSLGYHGLVTTMVSDIQADVIYTCGPAKMLEAVSKVAKLKKIPCFVSMEERMACGVGACLGCACGLLDENGQEYFGHVCKDGPVFDALKVAEFAI